MRVIYFCKYRYSVGCAGAMNDAPRTIPADSLLVYFTGLDERLHPDFLLSGLDYDLDETISNAAVGRVNPTSLETIRVDDLRKPVKRSLEMVRDQVQHVPRLFDGIVGLSPGNGRAVYHPVPFDFVDLALFVENKVSAWQRTGRQTPFPFVRFNPYLPFTPLQCVYILYHGERKLDVLLREALKKRDYKRVEEINTQGPAMWAARVRVLSALNGRQLLNEAALNYLDRTGPSSNPESSFAPERPQPPQPPASASSALRRRANPKAASKPKPKSRTPLGPKPKPRTLTKKK